MAPRNPGQELASAAGRALSARRKTFGGGRPPKLSPCPVCGQPFSVTAMRKHAQVHARPAGRPPILRPCPEGCGQDYGATAMRAHLRTCHGLPALGDQSH